jgi:hypothetical protein
MGAALGLADGWLADDGRAAGLGDELALGPGDGRALGLAGTLTLGLGKLPTAFLTVLPHPAAEHPAARIAAERTRHPLKRRIPGPFAYPLFDRLVSRPSH